MPREMRAVGGSRLEELKKLSDEMQKLRSGMRGVSGYTDIAQLSLPALPDVPDLEDSEVVTSSLPSGVESNMVPRAQHDAVLQEFRRLVKEMERMVPRCTLDSAQSEIERLASSTVPTNQFNAVKSELKLLYHMLSGCLQNVIPKVQPESVKELLHSLIDAMLRNAPDALQSIYQGELRERPDQTHAGDSMVPKSLLQAATDENQILKAAVDEFQLRLQKAEEDLKLREKDKLALCKEMEEMTVKMEIEAREASQKLQRLALSTVPIELLDASQANVLSAQAEIDRLKRLLEGVVEKEQFEAAQSELRHFASERTALCKQVDELLLVKHSMDKMIPREKYDEINAKLLDSASERDKIFQQLEDAVRQIDSMVPKEQLFAVQDELENLALERVKLHLDIKSVASGNGDVDRLFDVISLIVEQFDLLISFLSSVERQQRTKKDQPNPQVLQTVQTIIQPPYRLTTEATLSNVRTDTLPTAGLAQDLSPTISSGQSSGMNDSKQSAVGSDMMQKLFNSDRVLRITIVNGCNIPVSIRNGETSSVCVTATLDEDCNIHSTRFIPGSSPHFNETFFAALRPTSEKLIFRVFFNTNGIPALGRDRLLGKVVLGIRDIEDYSRIPSAWHQLLDENGRVVLDNDSREACLHVDISSEIFRIRNTSQSVIRADEYAYCISIPSSGSHVNRNPLEESRKNQEAINELKAELSLSQELISKCNAQLRVQERTINERDLELKAKDEELAQGKLIRDKLAMSILGFQEMLAQAQPRATPEGVDASVSVKVGASPIVVKGIQVHAAQDLRSTLVES